MELLDEWNVLDIEMDLLGEGERVTRKLIPLTELYFKEETGFGIYSVELLSGTSYVMKGKFPGSLTIGNTYEVEADVTRYRGELQLNVLHIKVAKAEGRRAIIFYLQTLHGLKTRAESIYDTFGDKTLDVMTNNPNLVAARMNGIGKKTAMKWSQLLKEKAQEEEQLLFLFGLGLNPTQVETLQKTYGSKVRDVLESNPYRLIQDVRGYGFKRCDTIAQSSGITFNDGRRIRAGIIYILQLAVREGNTYLPQDEVKARVQNMLGLPGHQIDDSAINDAVEMLALEGAVVNDHGHVYMKKYFVMETEIAYEVERLASPTAWAKTDEKAVTSILDDYLNATGIHLEEKQRKAVETFSSKRGGFYILNGSAGCGKTFTLKVILAILQSVHRSNGLKYSVKIMAPTGKASKVASKATGNTCITIHRGLEFSPEEGFTRHAQNPLDENVIVVDESSMLDTELARDLLVAIKSGAKVIFLGDTKQLPSVGAGNVLLDLIGSGVVDVVTLDVVKRQGAESGIIENANRIIRGEMVETQNTNDSFVLPRQSDEDILQTTIHSYRRLLEKGMRPEEVQVLTPQRKGLLGIYNLNRVFQGMFNPNGKASTVHNLQMPDNETPLHYRVGDKVIHIQNDIERTLYNKDDGKYWESREKGITNGECGVVAEIVTVTKRDELTDKLTTTERIIVKYEDWYVYYEGKDDLEMLDHAYALTIHKSQGSQWQAVIQPVSMSHMRMLDNNLLYTGETRASLFHCYIAYLYALERGIKTFRVHERYTGLLSKLKND